MHFSLNGMDDFIRHSRAESKYILYAYVLSANPSSKVFYEEMINLFELIHSTTTKEILVVAPQVDIGKQPGVKCSTQEVIEILETGFYYNYLRRESVDVSELVKSFIRQYIDQSIAIAKEYEILGELPAVLFTGSLNNASRENCFIFSIKNKSASDVAELFREVSHLCQIGTKDYFEKNNELEKIRSLISNVRLLNAKKEEDKENKRKENRVASAKQVVLELTKEIESVNKKLMKLQDGNGYKFYCPYRKDYFFQDNYSKMEDFNSKLNELECQLQEAISVHSRESSRDVSVTHQQLAEIEDENRRRTEYLDELRQKEVQLASEVNLLRPTPSSIVAPLVRKQRIRALSASMFKSVKELVPFIKLFK